MKKVSLVTITLILLAIFSFAEELTIWVSWEGEEFFTQVAKAYSQRTGIDVKVLHVPKLDKKLFTALRTGNLPDISMVKDTDTGRIADSDFLVKLDRADLESLGFFSEKNLIPYSVNGLLVAVPYYADVQVVFANLDLLENVGIELDYDYTIEDLIKLKDKFAGTDIIPVAWDFMSSYVFYPFLTRFGNLWDENGKPAFNSPSIAEAITYIKNLFDQGVFTRLNRGALVNSFEEGKIAVVIQGSYLAKDFEESGIRFTLLPFPLIKGERVKPIIDSKGFAIFNPSKKDVALDFLKFLYSQSTDYCIEYNKIPMWTTDMPEELEELNDILNVGQYMYNGMKFQSFYFSTMRTVLQAVYSGSLTADEALESAQNYVNSNW